MSFTLEVAQLVADCYKSNIGWDVTAKELLDDNPWYKIVGLSWQAHVHFKHEGWVSSLDEVTEPQEKFTIRNFIGLT